MSVYIFVLDTVAQGNASEAGIKSRFNHPNMCGGAMGMIRIGRAVWACDDPWGGSGRLIAWNKHPAFVDMTVSSSPFADLEREAATLFAPEARRVYREKGWPAWQRRYPEICAEFEQAIATQTELREVQKTVTRAPRRPTKRKLEKNIGVTR